MQQAFVRGPSARLWVNKNIFFSKASFLQSTQTSNPINNSIMERWVSTVSTVGMLRARVLGKASWKTPRFERP